MHPVLLEHPDRRRVFDQLEEVGRREQAWRLGVQRRLAAFDQARRDWELASLEAATRGDPLPDPPQQPEIADLAGHFRHQREQLQDELERVEQGIAGDVERAAAERESELLTALAEELEKLNLGPVVDELGLLVQAVGFVRRRVDPRAGSPADHTRVAVGLEEVIAAATANRSLLGPVRQRRRAPVEREHALVDPELAARMRLAREPSPELRMAYAKHRADRTDPRRR